MRISTVDVIICVKHSSNHDIWGEQAKESGKFFVNGGHVLGSCKTPLTRKALSCLYFRMTKAEEHIIRALVRIHRPTCEVTNASVVCSLHFEQNFYRRLHIRDPLQWRCLNKDIAVLLSSLHTNRNKLKGSENFNLGSHYCDIVICVCYFASTRDLRCWFLAYLLT